MIPRPSGSPKTETIPQRKPQVPERFGTAGKAGAEKAVSGDALQESDADGPGKNGADASVGEKTGGSLKSREAGKAKAAAVGGPERFPSDLKLKPKNGKVSEDEKTADTEEDMNAAEHSAALHGVTIELVSVNGKTAVKADPDASKTGNAAAGSAAVSLDAALKTVPADETLEDTVKAGKNTLAKGGVQSAKAGMSLKNGKTAETGVEKSGKNATGPHEKALKEAAGKYRVGEADSKEKNERSHGKNRETEKEKAEGESRAVKLEVLDARAVKAAGGPDAGNGGHDGSSSDSSSGAHHDVTAGEGVFGSRSATETQATDGTVKTGLQQDVRADLLKSLQEDANAQIVKNARIMLRNNDRGEISLKLKPEHLGTVRISLFLEDNHIAGRIIVENNTVREAFEQNLQSLQQAFSDQGFVTGNLDVSVGDGGKGNGGRRDEDAPHAARIREIEKHTVSASYEYDGYLNLVV